MTDSVRNVTLPVLAFVALLTVPMTFAVDRMTPLLIAVHDAPALFNGSDGRRHLAYEVWITNFTSREATVERVGVFGGDGKQFARLDRAEIATRLQPAGRRDASAVLPSGGTSLLFVHVTLPPEADVPERIVHRIAAQVPAAPPPMQNMTLEGGDFVVDRRPAIVIGPPLRGAGYIAADSCCDATRHTRAALPVNGRVRIAQRFAVDWEQLDDASRIYVGPREQLTSYTIYGREAIAVADARVVSAIDGLPEQIPGKFPDALPLDQADGNSVVLDLGNGRFALYGHFKQGSVRVHSGDRVKRGQVLGLVGNSGNSLAPHLHFHVMDGPSPLDSNGLPYGIDEFEITGQSPGTEAFDTAEAKGTPLPVQPITPPRRVRNALPLDQGIVRFAK
jgi:peptidase M23-like protein